MITCPLVADGYHGPESAAYYTLAGALTSTAVVPIWCPRGDLNPHALLGH